jgi:hypothetical protein
MGQISALWRVGLVVFFLVLKNTEYLVWREVGRVSKELRVRRLRVVNTVSSMRCEGEDGVGGADGVREGWVVGVGMFGSISISGRGDGCGRGGGGIAFGTVWVGVAADG